MVNAMLCSCEHSSNLSIAIFEKEAALSKVSYEYPLRQSSGAKIKEFFGISLIILSKCLRFSS
jgi:hypothetical protein